MKKNIIIGLVSILLLLLLIYFFNVGKFNKKNLNNLTNLGNKSNISNPEQKALNIENNKKGFKKSDKAFDRFSENNKEIENNKEKESNKKIDRQKYIVNVLEKKGYGREIDNYLKSICEGKNNIDDISCSSSYRFFIPRLYGLLLELKKQENLTYNETQSILVSHILKNCYKLDNSSIELLIRGIKENDNTCTKDIVKIYKYFYKKLNNDSIYSLNLDRFYIPISIYYSIPSDLTDNYQKNLQLLIFKKYDKLLKSSGLTKNDYNKKLLNLVGAYSVENLKQLIVNEYKKLFKKYNLSSCGLRLSGYDNYFEWIPIARKAVDCIKVKGIVDDFLKDYEKIDKLISIYSYISKVFPTEKLQAKIVFGKNGVGIANIIDIIALLKK